MKKQVRIELGRRTLLDFIRYTKPDYQVNWHHRLICNYLDRFIARDIENLMLFMPPRHGKSEIVSRRLPAYILGKMPDSEIIANSYSADLASRMNRDVQRIIDSLEYRELFPETQLFGRNVRTIADGSYLRNSDIFEVVGKRGVYRSAGVGGGIVGMGFHYGIIDDPIKN
ncbi:MAG: terminase family protein, partial [Anaerolineae bacterium]|nr:terminase family protein [Anaerolineae bacterium]